MAATTIINHDKKNVLAIFGNRELYISNLRKDAFLNTIQTKALDVSVVVKFADSSLQASKIVQEIFSKKNNIDQIICMSDEILISVMKKAYELKLKIPEKVGILTIAMESYRNYSIPQLHILKQVVINWGN